MGIESQIVIKFAPQAWGELDFFQQFYRSTYNYDDQAIKALRGAANNFHKAMSLYRVAALIAPRMEEDNAELAERGFTAGNRSHEYTAVVEALYVALYSAIDCTRKVLQASFPKAQGLPDSTRKLFANAKNGTIGQTIPEGLRKTLAQADWYTEFRVLRDALTHTDTGSCHLNRETKCIAYFHDSLRGVRENGHIADFSSYIKDYISKINQFLGNIYRELNTTLKNEEVWTMCGIFYGRCYSRFVKPFDALDFNSGRCDAYTWFELEENPTCPFASSCEAYSRRATAVI